MLVRTSGMPPWLDRTLMALIVAGLLVTPLSVGLQGLDALDLRLSALAQKLVWETGLETSYGITAIAAMVALFAALFAFEARGAASARGAPAVARGLDRRRLALALSGHASNATPQLLTRPSVFVHVVCVVFWVGALLPLIATVKAGEGGPLARFSRVIPYPLAALVISGVDPGGGATRPRRRAVDDELRPRAVMQARGGGRAARARPLSTATSSRRATSTRTQPRRRR